VGTIFGAHGVNIISAAVGRHPEDAAGDGQVAVMAVTTSAAVPAEVIAEIVASDGFVDGRTVSL
jgi:D-3-phosphoglycerate dehydrogenase